MKISKIILFSLIFGLSILAVKAETIAITGGLVHDMKSNAPIHNATIVLKDGKIAAIGQNIDIPQDAQVITANGKIITPGFMSSASYIGLTEVLAEQVTNDVKGSHKAGSISHDVAYGFNPNSTLIPILRQGGLTRANIIPMADKSPVAGLGALIHLGIGDKLITNRKNALYVEMGEKGAALGGGSRGASWGQLTALLDKAQKYNKGNSKSPNRPADLLPVIDVLNNKIPLVITADRASDIQLVINLSRRYDITPILIGGAESWMKAKELAAANIPVIIDPTLNIPDLFETINARRGTAAVLYKTGVKIGFSMPRLTGLRTPGFTHNADKIRISAGIAVANGLPYPVALKALTVTPSNIWGISEAYGTLQKGLDADIVIWSGDPLEMLSHAETVIIKGQVMPKTTRHKLLRDRYHPENLKKAYPPKYTNE